MTLNWNWKAPALLTLVFWIFCLVNIKYPLTHSFDEAHYIPATKTFLETGILKNREHPPLGKLLIAPGIMIFGDTQLGWRVTSTIFGALTLLGIYFWAFHLFGSVQMAMLASVLTIANFMLYVQARIAMLDTFMMAFLIWAFATFSLWWKDTKNTANGRKMLMISAALFGLASAVKWFALIPFAVAGLFVVAKYLKKKIKFGQMVKLAAVFVGAYGITFIPMVIGDPDLNFSISNFFQWQIDIWTGQRNVVGAHPYTSQWWTWPLQTRPIWYAYDREPGTNFVRGVVLLGNPILMWGTVLAVAKCLYEIVKEKSQASKEVLLAFVVCFLAYAIIPRKVTFFYYYYPAGLVLGLVWAQALRNFRWKWIFAGVCMVLFIYFLPVLGAWPIADGTLGRWMWFRSWI